MKTFLILLAVLATPFASQAASGKTIPACYGAENVSQKEPFLLTVMNVTTDEELAVTDFLLNLDLVKISRTSHFDSATTFVLSVNESALPQDQDANISIGEALIEFFKSKYIGDDHWALECNRRMVPTPRGGGAN